MLGSAFVVVRSILCTPICEILVSLVLKRYLSFAFGLSEVAAHTHCDKVPLYRVQCETVSPVPIINEPANLC